jgi:excisionase family DNA binding protein
MGKPKDELLTIPEAATCLRLASSTVYHGGAGTSEIARVRFGRSVRLKRSDVEAFADRKHRQAEDRLRRPGLRRVS